MLSLPYQDSVRGSEVRIDRSVLVRYRSIVSNVVDTMNVRAHWCLKAEPDSVGRNNPKNLSEYVLGCQPFLVTLSTVDP